jgi:hypothetical protein
VEAAYTRLGEFGYSSSVTSPAADTVQGNYKVNALSLSALGFVPLQSNWSIYGKAGLARTDTTFSAASATGALIRNACETPRAHHEFRCSCVLLDAFVTGNTAEACLVVC